MSDKTHPGNPSDKFIEEKLLISEMLRKWNEVADALPMLKSKLYLCKINPF